MEKNKIDQKLLRMQDRQRILRNGIALLSVGKATVIGAGMALAVIGYVDLAANVLPDSMVDLAVNGFSTEAAAGIGGLLGAVTSLVIGLLR